ncbi:hypothetical protein A9Q86_02540 [Flavobacteriales bacterium 33_180_T64]|nr:hypothetical protein A9Q86_02540 [Flavobacteriales bacterium 33_180_T64]
MFNIITPTYNRKHTLQRVYDSLLDQDFKDFEWIIIDDASTDNTFELVEEWIHDNIIKIVYKILPKNQGKSDAVNFGLDLCSKPYTIIADSDDSFDSNTLSDLKKEWTTIESKQLTPAVASIWTHTKNDTQTINGDKFPKDKWLVGFEERVLNHNIKGEKWASWKTEILKDHKMFSSPFTHIEESQTWNSINKTYDFLCLNIAHRCYYYSPDGIMASKKTRKQLSISSYYSSYYGLKDVSLNQMIKHKHYRHLAFNYAKSRLFYSNKNLKLSFNQLFVSIIIFLFRIPKSILKKIG